MGWSRSRTGSLASFAGAVLFATVAFCVAPAHAQTPSTDDIIRSLKPSSLGGPTRGLRAIPTTGSEPAAPVEHRRPAAGSTQAANRPANGAPAAPSATAQSDSSGQRSIDMTIEFRTGSAELTPQAAKALDNLGRALASPDLVTFRFRIAGHTDTVGVPDANLKLSQARAQTVATYLEEHHGIAPTRLETVGKGSEELAVPTGPQVPEIRNRRVQVVNLGA